MSAALALWQRATAVILAPLVLLHLGVILYAVKGGFSAAEILGRTQGSWLWGSVYGLFVVAAAVHGPIGLRVVLAEWVGWHGRAANLACLALGLLLLLLGLRAVVAVV